MAADMKNKAEQPAAWCLTLAKNLLACLLSLNGFEKHYWHLLVKH
jgi:hypothetical protein